MSLPEAVNGSFIKLKLSVLILSESLTEKGVKAAGPGARKTTLELEKLLKEFRKVSVEESKK